MILLYHISSKLNRLLRVLYVSSPGGYDLYSSPFSTVIINCQDGRLMSAGVTWREDVTLKGTSIWPLITVQKGFSKAKRTYEFEFYQLFNYIFWSFFVFFSKVRIKVERWKPQHELVMSGKLHLTFEIDNYTVVTVYCKWCALVNGSEFFFWWILVLKT